MSKYRKKPVEIDAFQIHPDHWVNPSSWPEWFFKATEKEAGEPGFAWMGEPDDKGLATVEIFTLEGVHTAHVGDWIICGVKGELYPCKDDIFRMTYEKA